MSRGSLPKSFTRWGSPREQMLGTSGRGRMPTGRISRAFGLLWRSREPSSLASSLRIRREGRKCSPCSPRLGHVQSLPEMRMLQIRRRVGGRFQGRIILSGSSRGLSRRRKRSEEFARKLLKTMTTSQQITRVRCTWAANELNIPYHDEEWGVPAHDERKWFEFLILEGAQAGLSWDTILRKRARYREVFDGFDPDKVVRYDKRKVRELLADPGIIRNRLKIEATISNARLFLKVQEEFGTFDSYVWRFVGGKPKQNAWKTHKHLPARTPESDALSKDLQKRGFRFVGSTICYAFMQATGLVNDHLMSCFRHLDLSK